MKEALKYFLAILAMTISTADAHLIRLTDHFVFNDIRSFAFYSRFTGEFASGIDAKQLAVDASVPGQASGTSFSGPLDGGSFTIDFRDTASGQVADVTFDLSGTDETLAGFIVFGPRGLPVNGK